MRPKNILHKFMEILILVGAGFNAHLGWRQGFLNVNPIPCTAPIVQRGGIQKIRLGRDGFLRKLKGAALSIMLALYANARSWGIRGLALVTGWSTVQVNRSLCKLQSLGWVEQHGR